MGIFVVIIGVAVAIWGLTQQLKAKKILAAPFKKTGEIASNPAVADPKGLVSCEGKLEVAQPLVAPCSNKQCLYYEVKVERLWEKEEATEDGTKKTKGSSEVEEIKKEAAFSVNDGSGPLPVAPKGSLDADVQKTHESTVNIGGMIPSELVFGQLRYATPSLGGEGRTVGFKATEKIIAAEGNAFVMGKLEAGAITKPDGMLGKVLMSTKGREGLLGATNRNMKVGYGAGAGVAVLGIILQVTGVGSGGASSACPSQIPGVVAMCNDRVESMDSDEFTWTVTVPGTYKLFVDQPKEKKNRIFPLIQVKKGAELVAEGGGYDDDAVIEQKFEPGTYTVVVKDNTTFKVKGGYSYKLDISSPDVPTAAPAGTATAGAETAPAGGEAAPAPAGTEAKNE